MKVDEATIVQHVWNVEPKLGPYFTESSVSLVFLDLRLLDDGNYQTDE